MAQKSLPDIPVVELIVIDPVNGGRVTDDNPAQNPAKAIYERALRKAIASLETEGYVTFIHRLDAKSGESFIGCQATDKFRKLAQELNVSTPEELLMRHVSSAYAKELGVPGDEIQIESREPSESFMQAYKDTITQDE